MTLWGMGLLLALGSSAATPPTALPLEVLNAPDGALLLREVEAHAMGGTVQVSGRLYRTRLTRVVVGRGVLVTLVGADGRERARRHLPLPAAALPRGGLALSPFSVSLPIAALPGDTVTLAIPAVGASP